MFCFVSRSRVAKITISLFFVPAIIFLPLAKLAWATDGGECCNEEDNASCSGCKSFGFFYMSIGQNTVYHCKDYVNPLTCEESERVCWESTGVVNLYSDSNCENITGNVTDPSVSVVSCPYDSCD